MSPPPTPARVLAIAACALAVLAGPGTASAATPQTNLADIEDEVMCTVCGTLLELSEAPQAERQRALIRRLIDEGQSKEQIKDALVAEYGSEVLATPGDSGFDLVAWIVPGLAIGAAAAIGGLLLIRRIRQRPTPRSEVALDPTDAARLDEDMSRYRP